jgi:ribosomal-protein-alanine N-acetyltransferase
VSFFPLPIKSEHVCIRSLDGGDLEDLYALETDPEVKRYISAPVPTPKDEWMRPMRDRLGADTCALAIILNDDGSFVGSSLGVTCCTTTSSDSELQIESEIEIQVLIARRFWGNGFGRDAVSELIRAAFELQEVTSIVAVVDPENTASRKLMDNLGFQHDGQKSSPGCWDDNHIIFRLARPREKTALTAPATLPHSSHG